jgi:hypothetical protein
MRRKIAIDMPWKDIEVSTPRGKIERVSLAVMEVRSAYSTGDGYTYVGKEQYVATAWVVSELDRHKPVNLRCKKLQTAIVYQVGDCFQTMERARSEMMAIKDGSDWDAWRWLALEELR